jgi:hypothetical protein
MKPLFLAAALLASTLASAQVSRDAGVNAAPPRPASRSGGYSPCPMTGTPWPRTS